MKEFVKNNKELKNIILENVFDYFKIKGYLKFLEDLTNPKHDALGDPYIYIELSSYYLPNEQGYFGEGKVRFEDNTFTDKIERIVEVSYEEFYDILTKQTEKYLETHEEEKEEVNELMQKIKERLAV